ncbi:cAMP-dependent protein kinase catalytic subunit gamma-like [Daktulosphaira vitifoliae]|uniref:cAMP-dependent protein kinase catalytic subunit gamma-like n=1 Tax=Daktulosphaira vitifoliae TaxID=58002 RepID=UPI0021AA71C1|nr:cAMP-dependent protein kinase catalytic subunit gamma-like [Daktulosphaira vitifoliae]
MVHHISSGQLKIAKVFTHKVADTHKKYVDTEKNILAALDGLFPFTIGLHFLAKDPERLYLIMPLVPGGNLFDLLYAKGPLGEQSTLFYSSQVVLALEFLHATGFVHRDLKPENLFIDANGYLRLADFGMVKMIGRGRTYTFCGTPEYMAPEIITFKGYGQSVDFWSLGVLIYELNVGRTPFEGSDVREVFENALNINFRLDNNFSPQLKSLLQRMLEVDLSKRYGNLKNGILDIKKHPWFRPINWLLIINQKMEAPLKPNIEFFQYGINRKETEFVDF